MSQYNALIAKVSREVAFEFAAPSGRNGHGYEVATAEDIEQRVHLKLLEEGIDDSYFDDLDDPQGSLRLFARHAAQREVETRHRRHDGTGLGYREATLDLSDDRTDSDSPGAAIARTLVSSLGTPLTDMLRMELETRLQDLAEDLISKVPATHRSIVRDFYLAGLDVNTIAEEARQDPKTTSTYLRRGRAAIHPDEEASLRALRAYFHPEAKLPGRIKVNGTATALLDLLAT